MIFDVVSVMLLQMLYFIILFTAWLIVSADVCLFKNNQAVVWEKK